MCIHQYCSERSEAIIAKLSMDVVDVVHSRCCISLMSERLTLSTSTLRDVTRSSSKSKTIMAEFSPCVALRYLTTNLQHVTVDLGDLFLANKLSEDCT